MASSSAALEPWRASFTWRLEGFSKLPTGKDDFVCSETFEAGVSSWRLLVFPGGTGVGGGTHLSVDLQVVDDMWAPTASATLMLVNQADGDNSHSVAVPEAKYDAWHYAWHGYKVYELPAVKATPGVLVDDALVLTVDITVLRKTGFALDSDGFPSDLVLKLPSGAELSTHWHPLRMASKVLCRSPESASLLVEGSLSAWTYIKACPLHDAPALTLGGAFALLPMAHKYGFTKLVTRLVNFIKGQSLLCDPQHPSKYIVSWVMLAEHLQLDDLLEQRVQELGVMPRNGLARALLVGTSTGQLPAALRDQMKELRSGTRDRLLAMTTSRLYVAERELDASRCAEAAATSAEVAAKKVEAVAKKAAAAAKGAENAAKAEFVDAEDKLKKVMIYADARGWDIPFAKFGICL